MTESIDQLEKCWVGMQQLKVEIFQPFLLLGEDLTWLEFLELFDTDLDAILNVELCVLMAQTVDDLEKLILDSEVLIMELP